MSADEARSARQPPSLSPPTRRALRAAALRVAEARRARDDAIVAAHAAGADMPAIARETGLDAFDVRDVLVRAAILRPLRPKEAAARSGGAG